MRQLLLKWGRKTNGIFGTNVSTATAQAVDPEKALIVDIDVAEPRWDRFASVDFASFNMVGVDCDRFAKDLEAGLTLAVTLGALDLVAPAEVAVRLTNDLEVRELNSGHRGLDKATDILSFPLYPDVYTGPRGPLLGDLVLAYETCMADASALQIAPRDHMMHLCVHGFLHLFGYDHEDEAAAQRMEQLEVEILQRLSIANPYAIAT